MSQMPVCLDCHHDFAAHVRLGPATGAYRCRAEGCDCRAYVARTAAIAEAQRAVAA